MNLSPEISLPTRVSKHILCVFLFINLTHLSFNYACWNTFHSDFLWHLSLGQKDNNIFDEFLCCNSVSVYFSWTFSKILIKNTFAFTKFHFLQFFQYVFQFIYFSVLKVVFLFILDVFLWAIHHWIPKSMSPFQNLKEIIYTSLKPMVSLCLKKQKNRK